MPDTMHQLTTCIESHRTARDVVLSAANLRGAQLARLRGEAIHFEEADLREASFREAIWHGCLLRDARLESADFTDAVLRMCDFDQTRASSAVFTRARLENSTARGARFDAVDFSGAVLTDTDFSRASLRGANLEDAQASGVDFRGADLSGANLRNAVLSDTDFRGADLTLADLTGADLHGADLRGVIGADALAAEAAATDAMPADLKALAETMSPVVREVLRTAGRHGAIDATTLDGLMKQLDQTAPVSPENAPSEDTMLAVSRVLNEMGDDVIPTLMRALKQPNNVAPPPDVQALILRLRERLSLDESATAEDVLNRLAQGLGRRPG